MVNGWIVCGDFNVNTDDEVISRLRHNGFNYSHAEDPDAATCNANRRARMIDFLFHDARLSPEPIALTQVRDDTPLPDPDEPSDHVAVAAKLRWSA